jgi:hypothetical protein
MTGIKISNLPAATTPLTGAELVPIVQGGGTSQTSVANLLGGPAGSSLVGYLPAGTGAVATTVQTKMRESVSVKDFGAKGDGITDDSTKIEAASLSLFLAGGGDLILPPGTFILGTLSADVNSINSYITLRNGVNIIGSGRGVTTLKIKSGENTRFTASNAPNVMATTQAGLLSNVRIADLTIDWNGANNLLNSGMTVRNNASILTINGAENVTVERVNFKECPGNQDIYFKNQNYATTPGSNMVVRDCEFKNVGSGLTGNYNLDHTSVYICEDDSIVDNCRFNSSIMVNGTCFELHGSRNSARGNKSNYFGRGFYLASDYADVTDFTVVDGFHNNCAASFAISAQTYAVNNCVVSRNTFRQAAGLTFGSVNYFLNGSTIASNDRLEITDNIFIGLSYANNRFAQHYKTADFVFDRNTVKGFADVTNGYGIISANQDIGGSRVAHSISICDNIWDDVLVPISYVPATLGVDLLRIQNNTFYVAAGGGTAGADLNLNSGTGVVSGNRAKGFTSVCKLLGSNDIAGGDVFTIGSVAYTPAVVGSTTAGAGTYSVQSGTYQIDGKRCKGKIGLSWSAHTGTGNIRVSLPFTSKTGGSVSDAATIVYVNTLTWVAGSILFGTIDPNTNYVGMYSAPSAGSAAAVPMDTAAILYLTFDYELP